jgi:hypothetical protein
LKGSGQQAGKWPSRREAGQQPAKECCDGQVNEGVRVVPAAEVVQLLTAAQGGEQASSRLLPRRCADQRGDCCGVTAI